MSMIRYKVDMREALAEADVTGESVVIYENVEDTSEFVAYPGGHAIQLGGRDGDGFCFTHQSFDCIESV